MRAVGSDPIGRVGDAVAGATLRRLLGRGGGGEVWAVDTELGPAALKLVDRTEVLTEARAVAALEHPHIVEIYDLGTTTLRGERCGYLLQPLADGTLADREGEGGWRQELLQLLDALAHAHSRGVVHLDLKPSNVLVHGDRLWLADFGAAHRVDQEADAPRRGSVRWMAPEQLLGRWRDVGPATDLYAVGLVAWWRARGELPWGTDDPTELARRRSASAPDARGFSEPLQAWLARLLAPETAARFPSAATARQALSELPDLAPTPAPGTADATATATATATLWGEAPPRPGGTDVGPVLRAVPSVGALLQEAPPRPVSPRLSPRLFALRDTRLVGRTEERRALAEALRGALEAQDVRRAVVVGAAGMGKSRLARWLAQRAHELGATEVMAVHCSGASDGVAAALRTRFRLHGLTGDALRERLGSFLPSDVARTVGALLDGVAVGLTPLERRRWLLRAMATTVPMVWWFDDVHAHPDVLPLMDGLADMGLVGLVVATVRDDLAAPGLLEALRTPDGVWVPLGPLSTMDHRRMVATQLHVTADVAEQLAHRTGRHPLFTAALLADWAARGLLARGPRGWQLEDADQLELPDGLYEAWIGRLAPVVARHGPEQVEPLALVGEPIAADAVPIPVATDLAEQGLLVPDDDGWRWCHGLAREALEEHARRGGRRRGHHEALAARAEDPGDRGWHLLEAGRYEEALPSLQQVLEAQRRRGDGPTVLRWASRLEEALDGIGAGRGDPRRLHAWVCRGEALRSMGRYDEAHDAVTRVIEGVPDGAEGPTLAAALRCRGGVQHRRGRRAEAVADQERAVAVAIAVGDRSGRIESELSLGQLCIQRGERERGFALMRSAREGCAADTPPKLAAQTLVGAAYAANWQRDYAEAVRWAREARSRAEAHGWLRMQATVAGVESAALDSLGRYDEALARVKGAAEALEHLGSADAGLMWAGAANTLLKLERPGEAAPLLVRALDLLTAAGRWPLVAATHVVALWCDLLRGDEGWRDHLDAAEEQLAATGFVQDSMATALRHARDLCPSDARPRVEALLADQLERLA